MRIDHKYCNIIEKDLSDDEKNNIEELKDACKMQFPQFEGKIRQSTINDWIKKRLKGKNWDTEKTCPHGDRERFYFYKESAQRNIFVEVEYGNRCAIAHDLLKFVKTYQCKNEKKSLFILILPRKNMKVGKSNATWEYACNLMDKCKCISVPLIILGIATDNANDIIDVQELNYDKIEKGKYMELVGDCQPAIYFEER